jgi:hypothetical protein
LTVQGSEFKDSKVGRSELLIYCAMKNMHGPTDRRQACKLIGKELSQSKDNPEPLNL